MFGLQVNSTKNPVPVGVESVKDQEERHEYSSDESQKDPSLHCVECQVGLGMSYSSIRYQDSCV